MHDAPLLAAVLATPGLTPNEREAFESMAKALPRQASLTERQRLWLQRVASRVGVLSGDFGQLPPKVSAWDPTPRRGAKRQRTSLSS